MIYRFTTQNNSVYEIDMAAMTWTRVSHEAWSDQVRTDSGPLWRWRCSPDGRLVIIGPPLENTDADCRVITTSPVVSTE